MATKPTPSTSFSPADAEESLGKVGSTVLSQWARMANESLWQCMADGGEEEACRKLAVETADQRCKGGYGVYAEKDVPADAPVMSFDGGWIERRDHGQRIADVEVFRTGKWNGEDYKASDLDDMVTAFGAVGFRPPVKLGHDDNPSSPAHGWVHNLRRDGEILKADLEDLPEETYEAISKGRYDAVSSEIFFNLTRDKTKFRRALGAVAILGAQVPGVSNLKPLRASMAGLAQAVVTGTVLHVHSIPRGATMDKTPEQLAAEAEALRTELAAANAKLAELTEQQANNGADAVKLAQLAERVVELQRETAEAKEQRRLTEVEAKAKACPIPALRSHFTALYDLTSRAAETVKLVKFSQDGELKDVNPTRVIDDLMERVQKLSTGLLREHGQHIPPVGGEEGEDAGSEVHRLTQKHVAEKGVGYSDAMQAVLASNPDLARRYAGNGRH